MSSLSAAVHCLPLGIAGGITAYSTGFLVPRIPRRILLLSAQVLMAVGVVLLALADTPDKYWPYIVPGMIIGVSGCAAAYVGCTIVVMEGVRPGEDGVVGAVMYTAYQVSDISHSRPES